MLRLIAISIILLFTGTVQAGITIHFKGDGAANVSQIVDKACRIAESNGWDCLRVSGKEIEMKDRITAKSVMELDGSDTLEGGRGAVIYMHEMSEPMYLIFSASGKIDNFVKTQFAGPEVHRQAIELFDQIESLFITFSLEDESGFWKKRDVQSMEKEFMGVELMMKNILSQRSDVHGPIVVNGGRILDLTKKNR